MRLARKQWVTSVPGDASSKRKPRPERRAKATRDFARKDENYENLKVETEFLEATHEVTGVDTPAAGRGSHIGCGNRRQISDWQLLRCAGSSINMHSVTNSAYHRSRSSNSAAKRLRPTNKVRSCERSEPRSEPFVGQARVLDSTSPYMQKISFFARTGASEIRENSGLRVFPAMPPLSASLDQASCESNAGLRQEGQDLRKPKS